MVAKLADFRFSTEVPRVTKGNTVFTAACIPRSEGYYPSEVTLDTSQTGLMLLVLGCILC